MVPNARSEFLAGCRDIAPVLVGTVPFGFVAGVAAVGAGMTPLQGIALSFFAFSGIAQLVVAQLVAAQSPVLLTLAAALVVSLRFLMYSAALSPHVAHVYAVDASPAMLSAASARLAGCHNVTLSEGTLEALPLGDASLDAAVLMLVLREVAVLAALGIAIGLPGGYGLGRVVESQLFGLNARDPLTFAVATLALASTAFVAGLIPALRAARVDPMTALRYE